MKHGILAILITGSFAAVNVNAINLGDLKKALEDKATEIVKDANSGKDSEKKNQQPEAAASKPQNTPVPAPAPSQAIASPEPECPQDRQIKPLSFQKNIRAEATKLVLRKATKKLQLGEVELPEKIKNSCEAEKRIVYLNRSSDRWAINTVQAVEQAAKALKIDDEIESARVFKEGDSFSDLSQSKLVKFSKQLDADMKKIEAAILAKEAANKQLMAEAGANMRASTVHGMQISAWDKRLAEFMEDNIDWAFQDLSRAKLFIKHIKMFGGTVKSMQKITEAYNASNRSGVEEKEYQQILTKREKENEDYEMQIEQELQL